VKLIWFNPLILSPILSLPKISLWIIPHAPKDLVS